MKKKGKVTKRSVKKSTTREVEQVVKRKRSDDVYVTPVDISSSIFDTFSSGSDYSSSDSSYDSGSFSGGGGESGGGGASDSF